MAVENGLRFKVQSYKFRGVVEVVYNEGHDLFDVSFIKANKVVATANDIFFDMLVDVIDTYVERTTDYEKRVAAEYSFSDRKSTRLNSSHHLTSRMPSSA